MAALRRVEDKEVGAAGGRRLAALAVSRAVVEAARITQDQAVALAAAGWSMFGGGFNR